MKIRMKISYLAFAKTMPISELILRQIDRTYKKFVKEGIIYECPKQKKTENQIFDTIIRNGKDTLRMLALQNMMREGRLLGQCTHIEPGE